MANTVIYEPEMPGLQHSRTDDEKNKAIVEIQNLQKRIKQLATSLSVISRDTTSLISLQKSLPEDFDIWYDQVVACAENADRPQYVQ